MFFVIYFHSLAVLEDGRVSAWGGDIYGQCKVPDFGGVKVEEVSAGGFHSLARLADGSIEAWGHNSQGQLRYIPDFKAKDIKVKQVSAGVSHSLALLADETGVIAWGENRFGQCNVPYFGGVLVKEVSAGQYHSLARLSNGKVIAWGDDRFDQCKVPDFRYFA